MAQKPLQMKMAHQNAVVYWSNITFFETAAGRGTSFPVELTVKQNPFLCANHVLKGNTDLQYKWGNKEKLPNEEENENDILTSPPLLQDNSHFPNFCSSPTIDSSPAASSSSRFKPSDPCNQGYFVYTHTCVCMYHKSMYKSDPTGDSTFYNNSSQVSCKIKHGLYKEKAEVNLLQLWQYKVVPDARVTFVNRKRPSHSLFGFQLSQRVLVSC